MAQVPVEEVSTSFTEIAANLADMQAQIDTLSANLAAAAEMDEAPGIVVTPTLVSGLPDATLTVNSGTRATVTDSTVGLTSGIGLVVVGGGAFTVPVFADGTNWLIG